MSGLSGEELKALLRSVGTHRKQRHRSPLEVAQLLQMGFDRGWTRKECVDACQIGTTQVSDFLRLLKLSPEIQHLADWGRPSHSTVAFSSLAQLTGLPPPDQIRATKAILEHQLIWKEVVQLVQIANRSGKSIENCIDSVVKLRPEVEIKHLFVGSVASEALRASLTGLAQKERDALMEHTLRELLGSVADVSGRLGAKYFTIVSQRNPAEMLNMSADAFERTINEALLEATALR